MILTDELDYSPGIVARKTIIKNESGMIILMAFDKDTYLDTHFASGDVLVQILEGTCEFTVDGEKMILEAGESVKMLPGVPHSACAPERFKMLVTKLNLD